MLWPFSPSSCDRIGLGRVTDASFPLLLDMVPSQEADSFLSPTQLDGEGVSDPLGNMEVSGEDCTSRT